MEKRATWIWYPGDFELMLFGRCMARRYERDVMITPFWRMDGYYHNVKFSRSFTLTRPDRIRFLAEGEFNIFFEELGYIRDFSGELELPAGEYHMSVLVCNNDGLPCLFVEGEQLVSDAGFTVTCQDFWMRPAGCWRFGRGDSPNDYRLPLIPREFASAEELPGGTLYDYGREVFARLSFTGLAPGEQVVCCYGESREEALDERECEQLDRFTAGSSEYTTPITKAFRYVYVPGRLAARASLLEELPEQSDRSSFESANPLLKRIWDTSIRTIELTTREFFLDGCKRDRWSWSGDTLQSIWLNYYSFFDREVVKRTLRALGGKSPVRTHVNHIMDYTMYWIISLYECYRYTGDRDFVLETLPLAKEYIEFCLSRRNRDGFLEGLPNDWVFIDWADMDNRGETSFEQLLFSAALLRMAKLAQAAGESGERYEQEARALTERTVRVFYRDGAFVHSRREGVLSSKITRYANMFAVLFELVDGDMQRSIVQNVLLNEEVQPIVTPYMRFYELIVLCRTGHSHLAVAELERYWGGMLAEGATTFWEQYDPKEKGAEKYAMYGRPYGKSLCHAWGATPVYLIAACLCGIEPAEPGYRSFLCAPMPEALGDCRLTVPTNTGSVTVEIAGDALSVTAEGCDGTVVLPEGYRAHGERTVRLDAGGRRLAAVCAGEQAVFIREEVRNVV